MYELKLAPFSGFAAKIARIQQLLQSGAAPAPLVWLEVAIRVSVKSHYPNLTINVS